ncbi:hypothetical protein pb186bvf_004479 [Paramecium bursaria]
MQDSLQYSITESRQEIPYCPPPPELNKDHQEFITQEQDTLKAQLQQLQQDLLFAYQKIQDLEGINTQQKSQDQNKLHQMQQHYQLEMKIVQADHKGKMEEITSQFYQQIEDMKEKLKEKKNQFKQREQFLMTTADDYRKSLQGNELLSKQMISEKAKTIAEEQCKEYRKIIAKFEEEIQKFNAQSEDLQRENEKLEDQKAIAEEQDKQNKQMIVNLEEEKQKFKSKNEDLHAENEKLKQQVQSLYETIKQQEKKDQIPTKIKQNSNHINDQKQQQFMIQTNVYIHRQRGAGSKDQQDQRIEQNQFFTQPSQTQPIHSLKSSSQQRQGNIQRGTQSLATQGSTVQNNRYRMDVQGNGVKPPKPFDNSLNVNQSQTIEFSRFIKTPQSNSNSSRNLQSASGTKFIK